MKYSMLITFCLWAFSTTGQLNSSMPPEASIFYNEAMVIISPDIKKVVLVNSVKIKDAKMDGAQLLALLNKEPILRKIKKADLDWIAILIMVQASKNTDDALKKKVVELRKNPEESDLNEIRHLSEFKSFLANNTSQLLRGTTISKENALNNLKP